MIDRARRQAAALLLLAFVVGSVTGGAVVYARMTAERAARMPPPPMPGRFGPGQTMMSDGRHVLIPPDYEALGLTDDQRRQLLRILEEARPHTDSLLRQTLPALRMATDSLQMRMRAVLTPEQRARLDQ